MWVLIHTTPKSRARDIRSAAIDIGFFYLTGHGFAADEFERLLAFGRRFFALPADAKENIHWNKSPGKGYIPVGGINAASTPNSNPDQKERLYFAREFALSDADTLFKALPITPVILAPLYMRETGQSVSELAQKIVGEQVPLNDDGIYFYSESAKKRYEEWGEANLALWVCIRDALADPSVVELIGQVEQYTMISA